MIGTVEEPPGNFLDKDGRITGLSVDLVKEIQKRVKDTTPIEMLPAARLLNYSRTKKNYVVFSLSRSKAREKKYHWIALVMRKPLVIFAIKGFDFNVKKLSDAKKVKRIGVLRGSVQHDFLTSNGFKNIEPVDSHEQNFKKLIAGRIDLMYHSMHGVAKFCKDSGVDFSMFSPVLLLQISHSSIAMSKNSDIETVKKWQRAAKEIKRDGTFEKMARKWLNYTIDVIGIKSEIKDGALNFWKD